MRLYDILQLSLSVGLVLSESVKVMSTLYGHDSFIYQNQLYVVGGINAERGSLKQPIKISLAKDLDLVSTNEYQELQGTTDNTLPPPLEGTKVVVDSSRGKFYLVGGRSTDYNKNIKDQAEKKIVFRSYDLNNNRWEDLSSNLNTLPPERYLHSLVLLNNNIYLMGGKTFNESKAYDDVWKFSLSSNSWTSVGPSGTSFGTRYGHSVVAINEKKFVILGGMTGNEAKYQPININDMLIFDTSEDSLKPQSLKTANSPTNRMAFTTNVIDDRLFLIGGTGGDQGAKLNDIYSLDFTKSDWIKVKSDESTPLVARSYHSAQAYGQSIILTYGCESEVNQGGIQVFKTDSNQLFNKFTTAMMDKGVISQLNIGALVGGLVGGIAFIGIFTGALWYYRRRKLGPHHSASNPRNDLFSLPEEVGVEVLSNYESDTPMNEQFTDLGTSDKFSTGIWSSGSTNHNSTNLISNPYLTTDSKFIPNHRPTPSSLSNIDVHIAIGGPTPNTNFSTPRKEFNQPTNQFASGYGTSNIEDVKLFN